MTMTSQECLDTATVASVAQGKLPSDRRSAVDHHLARCSWCRLAVRESVSLQAPSTLSGRRWSLARWSVAAAALAAVAGVGFWRSSSSDRPPAVESFTIPQGETLASPQGIYAAGPGAERLLTLQDRTRLRLEPGTVVRFLPLDGKERAHLHIDAGAIEAEVSPGSGAFRISALAGEVRVLGTHLRVSVFDLKPAGPALCVEVYSGLVQLAGASRNVFVSSTQRGALVAQAVPETQRMGGDWNALLQAFALQVEGTPQGYGIPPERRDRAHLLAALLYGSRWERPLDLADSPADPEQLRRAKRLLLEMHP